MKRFAIALVIALSFTSVSFAKAKAPVAKAADYSMSAARVEVRELVKALNLNEAEYVLLKNAMSTCNEQIGKAARQYGVGSAEYVQAVAELDGKMEATILSIVSKYNKQQMYLSYKQANTAGLVAKN